MRLKQLQSTLTTLMLLSLFVSLSANATNPAKDKFKDWGKAGYNSDEYTTGFIEKTHPEQPQVGFIRSLQPNKQDFGTIMRTAGITQQKGKRIQLWSKLKTQDANSAGAWFRVNGKKRTLAFDNMSERRIEGTQDWVEVSLVLDIPEDATSVSYGILLEGEGKVWFQEPKFRVVDLTVKTTQRSKSELKQLQLENKIRYANQKNKKDNTSSTNTVVTKK